MKKLTWLCLGVIAALAVQAALGGFLLARARGLSARETPSGVEAWVARWARRAALPTGAKEQKNPVADSPEVFEEARAHWADHCASCHANDGSGGTVMGKNMYPQAPDMRLPATQNLTDGELFYIIQNGIRLTGMPAWGSQKDPSNQGAADHDAEASWKLVRFIRHLKHLGVQDLREMEKLNPKGPDDRKEEEEEEKFLRGESTNETQQQAGPEHHHH